MRVWLLLLLAIISVQFSTTFATNEQDDSEDDFAEFDDFDDDNEEDVPLTKVPNNQAPTDEDDFDDDEEEFVNEPATSKKAVVEDDLEDAIVEDVDSEFNHLMDEEEFEGFNTEEEEEEDEFEHMSTKGRGAKEKVRPKPSGQPTIKIANIPMMRTQWENYYLEMLMVAGIVVYFLNFFTGKAKNQKIATSWFNSHRPMLESNFSLIGDDGSKNIDDVETPLQKESEHLFTLWCSGRVCCEGSFQLLQRKYWKPLRKGKDQILGRICMEFDQFGWVSIPDDLKVDDLILIRECGAYDMTMSYLFGDAKQRDIKTVMA